jgi:hypothetical protein
VVVNSLALVGAAVLAFVLVDSHGARGAAVATVAGEAVVVIGQAIALRGSLPVPGLARTLLVVLAGAGLAVALFVALPISVVPAAVAAFVLYGAIVAGLGELPPQVRSIVPVTGSRPARHS